MDGDADDGADSTAEVRNTKSQLKAAIGAKFESLFEKMLSNSNLSCFSATLSTSWMMGLLQQQKSRFKSGVSSNWEKPQH